MRIYVARLSVVRGVPRPYGNCIVEYAPEEYTRHYIVQALFKLMNSYEYEKISVTDIAEKAGVGRATFYRYFKRKEDIIHYYFEHNKRAFIFEQHIYPRCKEDYIKKVTQVFTLLFLSLPCKRLCSVNLR